MKPFRNSLTARGVCLSAFVALIGAGLSGPLQIPVPIVFLVPLGIAFFSLMLGIEDYLGEVALLTLLAPVAFFVYVLAAIVLPQAPAFSWVPYAGAIVPLGLFIGSFIEDKRAAVGSARLEERSVTAA